MFQIRLQPYFKTVKFASWQQTTVFDELAVENVNKIWDVIHLLLKEILISCKWFFKFKFNCDDIVGKHKARLATRRFIQQYGTQVKEFWTS